MKWILGQESIDWDELSNLYTMAPLSDKKPNDLKVAFSNSMYKCFVFDDERWSAQGEHWPMAPTARTYVMWQFILMIELVSSAFPAEARTRR